MRRLSPIAGGNPIRVAVPPHRVAAPEHACQPHGNEAASRRSSPKQFTRLKGADMYRTKTNLTGRVAQWSATHRKRAIWGWLGLVFALLALVMGGQVVKQKDMSQADSFSGESRQAERALTDSGLRPNEEVAFIHSDDAVATDPEFSSMVDATAAKLDSTRYVTNVATPAQGGGAISDDGHSVLIDFEIKGDDLEAKDNVIPSEDTLAAVQGQNPEFKVEQVGSASTDKELDTILGGDLGKAGELSLPLTL